ncbi:MAG: hypothetical protein Q8M54_01625 [Desulfobaccales bacterium]|nr:hypothetical protein [Desulfobaccales bacterium]
MHLTKKLTADVLFAVQLVLAVVSGSSQFLRLLTTSQRGLGGEFEGRAGEPPYKKVPRPSPQFTFP